MPFIWTKKIHAMTQPTKKVAEPKKIEETVMSVEIPVVPEPAEEKTETAQIVE